MTGAPEDVPIRDESIRLGQFLKLANLVDSGSDAKPLLMNGAVQVNGEVETRRGRQLRVGDVVVVGGVGARVAGEAGEFPRYLGFLAVPRACMPLEAPGRIGKCGQRWPVSTGVASAIRRSVAGPVVDTEPGTSCQGPLPTR